MLTVQEQAINAALAGNFKKAIALNTKIIKAHPQDLDAYLRLGFACFQRGDFKNARKYYQKALKIQSANLIAQINLEKIAILEKRGKTKQRQFTALPYNPNLFLNVAGKTKVVNLIKLGNINLIAKLKIGQQAYLKIKKRRVEVRNENNEYIGALPDDISKRLIFFIEAKSLYVCYIKESLKNQVAIFLKEKQKGKKVENYISFPQNIKDDLKIMNAIENTAGDDENKHDDEKNHIEDEEESIKETPIDIETLAEEIDEKEEFPNDNHFKEESDDFEE